MCLGYFSVAMTKHHNQSNLQRKAFNLRPTAPEKYSKSMTTMVGSMATGRRGAGAVAEGLCTERRATKQRRRQLEWHGLLKPQVTYLLQKGHTSKSFPKGSTIWKYDAWCVCGGGGCVCGRVCVGGCVSHFIQTTTTCETCQ